MSNLTAPASLPSSITASTQALKGLELVNQQLRVFSQNLRKSLAPIVARLKATRAGVKTSAYYFLHLVSSARKSALNWLTEPYRRLTTQALTSARDKVKTVFRQIEKLASLTNNFPTSSSVNP